MMNFLRIPIRRQKLGLFLVDVVLLALSLPIATLIRGAGAPAELPPATPLSIPALLIEFFRYYTGATSITIVVFVACFFIFDLYDVEVRRGSWRDLAFLCLVSGIAVLGISTVYYLVPNWRVGRGLLGIQTVYITLAIFSWRTIYSRLHRQLVRPRRVLIIGCGESTKALIEEISNRFKYEFEVTGVISQETTPGNAPEQRDYCGRQILGGPGDLVEVTRKHGIEIVVSAISRMRGESGASLMKQILELKTAGLSIYEMPTFFKRITGRVPVDWIRDSWLVFNQRFSPVGGGPAERVHRAMDVAIALVFLLVSLPVVVLVAVCIKLTSMGPVLYRQERVGLNGKPYQIMKFRSMVVNAEIADTPVWSAGRADSRVTPIGRLLRRTRLDEIPNFLNVLNGDMSVVGPRPERKYFVEQLREEIQYYDLRFAVKPGLTGWAQVNYPYGASVEDARRKLEYDLFYIQERSFFLDLYILVKTAQTVLLRPGS